MVPDQVAQPPLGDPVQVDAAAAVVEFPAEVLGEDVAGLPGLRRRDVEGMQAAGDGGGNEGALPAGRLAQAGIAGGQVGEGAQAAVAAVVGKALDRGQFPLPVLPPGMPAHAPLDLGPQQRVQAPEIDLVRAAALLRSSRTSGGRPACRRARQGRPAQRARSG